MNRNTIGAALVVGLLAAACSGADATQPPPDTDTPTTTAAETAIEATAVDFGFEGLPETVPAGSTLTLVNESQVELHELVAVRLRDDEERSVEELLESPEDLAAYFASVATVVIAPPGEGGVVVEGTGSLDEPGRYAIVCAIPKGADPGEYMEAGAEAEGGPPDVAGGPPHFVHGMFAEVTVEGRRQRPPVDCGMPYSFSVAEKTRSRFPPGSRNWTHRIGGTSWGSPSNSIRSLWAS